MFSTYFVIFLMICSGYAEESIPQASVVDCKEKEVDTNEETLAEVPDSFPQTSFTCWDRYDGYYADVEVDCTIFHYCQTWRFPSGYNQTVKWDFVCPHSTIFNQKLLACTPPSRTFKCQESVDFYYVNYYVYNPTTAPEVNTTPQPAYEFYPELQIDQGSLNNQVANEFYGGTKPYDGLVFSENDQNIAPLPAQSYPSDPGSYGNISPNTPIETHPSDTSYPEFYEPADANNANKPDTVHLPDVNSGEQITITDDKQPIGQQESLPINNGPFVYSNSSSLEQSVNQIHDSIPSETSTENDVPISQNPGPSTIIDLVPDTPDSSPILPEAPDNSPTVPEASDNSPTVPDTPDSSPTVPDTPDSSPTVPDTPDNSPILSEAPDSSPTVPDAPSNLQAVDSNDDYNSNSGAIEQEPNSDGPDKSEPNRPISNGNYIDHQFTQPVVNTENVALELTDISTPEQPYATDLNSSLVSGDVSFPTESNFESTYAPPFQNHDESATNTIFPVQYPIDSNGFHENSRPSVPYQINTNPTVENNSSFNVDFPNHSVSEQEVNGNTGNSVEPVVTYPAVVSMFPNEVKPNFNAFNDSFENLHDDSVELMKLESEYSEIFGKRIRPYPIAFSSSQDSNETTEENTDDELVFKDEDYQKYSFID